MVRPICSSKRLFTFSVSLPDNKIKGIIRSDGNEDSIWISKSVADGKILFKSPKMGETANPGNAFNAEMENIPIKVMRGIVPCPVCTFILVVIYCMRYTTRQKTFGSKRHIVYSFTFHSKILCRVVSKFTPMLIS